MILQIKIQWKARCLIRPSPLRNSSLMVQVSMKLFKNYGKKVLHTRDTTMRDIQNYRKAQDYHGRPTLVPTFQGQREEG